MLRDVAACPGSPREEEFARLYEPVLRRYAAASMAGHEPLQPADCDDIVQEVFLAVRSALPGFHYDPARGRFRAYLRRAIRNAVMKLQRSRTVYTETQTADVAPDRGDDTDETLLRIWTLALARVFRTGRFSPNTKVVFRKIALEGAPADEVCRTFKLKPNAFYQIRSRIFRAVRAELDRFGRGRLSPDDLLEALLSAEEEEI